MLKIGMPQLSVFYIMFNHSRVRYSTLTRGKSSEQLCSFKKLQRPSWPSSCTVLAEQQDNWWCWYIFANLAFQEVCHFPDCISLSFSCLFYNQILQLRDVLHNLKRIQTNSFMTVTSFIVPANSCNKLARYYQIGCKMYLLCGCHFQFEHGMNFRHYHPL